MRRHRRHDLVALLAEDRRWHTAADLSRALGVTPRSVRSYVAQINAESEVVESGQDGYRLGAAASVPAPERAPDDPSTRRRGIALTLALTPKPIDLYRLADDLGVSESTLEHDLTRLREDSADIGVRITRSGPAVSLLADETARRRLAARSVRERGTISMALLRRSLPEMGIGTDELDAARTGLLELIAASGRAVNELALPDVLLHLVLSAARLRAAGGAPAEQEKSGAGPARSALLDGEDLAGALARLHARVFGAVPGRSDLEHQTALVAGRAATGGAAAQQVVDLRELVARAAAEVAGDFGLDLDPAPALLGRFALHIQNVITRAEHAVSARNPMTRHIKADYPLLFEMAVALSARLAELPGFRADDDELAFIAMHLGGLLGRRPDAAPVGVVIVCPEYYDFHLRLRETLERELGESISVRSVVTRADPEWSELRGELVISTLPPPTPQAHIVRIQPLPTSADVDRVREAVVGVRRSLRLARITADLLPYFRPEAFVHDPGDLGEEGLIRLLGAELMAAGAIDQEHVEQAVAREALSSTAFTPWLAVPHALELRAKTTAIAVAVSPRPLRWGEGTVDVVALVAFGHDDRAAFQTVFDQFAEVFSDRARVARIVAAGTSYAGFVGELAAVIES